MAKYRIRFHGRPYTGGTRPVARLQTPNNMWFVEKIEISGGFLPGLSVTLPQGLTCIIGARVQLSLGESTRALEANADRIMTAQRAIQDLSEQVEAHGDVRARLATIATSDRESGADFGRLSRQQQLNQREVAKLDGAEREQKTLGQTLDQLRREAQSVFAARLAEEQSANADTR